MGHGYQLETSSLGDNPILRRLKDNSEVRATVNRSTIEALQKRGLIAVAKAGGVLSPTVWRLASKAAREVGNDTGRT
jgi:ribosomal protein S19E (S16A)